MYARPIQVQTKVHFKILHFLVVTYDVGFFTLCYRRCPNGGGLFSLLKQFLEIRVHQSLLENAFSRIRIYVLRRVKG